MKITKALRRTIAAGVIVATFVLLTLIFFATSNALALWDRLQTLPEWLFYTYSLLILLVLGASGWVIYKLVRNTSKTAEDDEPFTEDKLLEELDTIEEEGIDASELRQELNELNSRKATGSIYVSLFGDVSTGKSSIIKALLPDAETLISVRGGSTQEVASYTWQSRSGDKLILTDLPGRNEESGELDLLSQEEAIRSQIVVYVTDSDLTRSMYQDIKALQSYGKPLILAINKSDRFNDEEQELIRGRIAEHFDDKQSTTPKTVFITSGGTEEVVRIYPDGKEEKIIRPRKAKIHKLAQQLQDEIDKQGDVLETLRDASVFVLMKQKLDHKKIDYKREKAKGIINSSTKKAVIGGMAAISPGADLVIQGVLGTLMVKDLCKLYETPVSQLDIDNFFKFSQGHMKSSVPLILAVAGNGLKAFPGIGTVAGGLVHAVAYGMIFDALGRAVAITLEERGALKAAPASLTFKEMLGDNLENRAKLFARMVLDYRKQDK